MLMVPGPRFQIGLSTIKIDAGKMRILMLSTCIASLYCAGSANVAETVAGHNAAGLNGSPYGLCGCTLMP